ncbi:MAG: DUF481 domain-containing protein [Deltaproteobacteria bacterium]|jgi:putative salt-induced outer membrane protein YdiY|nr:DUF481 domain-containing protein [Deltaproteobacteria bacterium]
MLKIKFIFIICLLFISFSGKSFGQIINVQSYMFQKHKNGVNLQLSGAGTYKRGNVDYQKLIFEGIFTYKIKNHKFLLFGGYNYAEKSGESFFYNYKEHGRYRYKFNKLLYLEVFAQHEHNKFKRLTLRALIGAGPSISVELSNKLNFIFGTSFMSTYLKYSESDSENDYSDSGEYYNYNRINTYLMLRAQLQKKLSLVFTFYYQPEIINFNNFLFLGKSELTVSINKILGINFSYSIEYNSTPPQTVEKTEHCLLVSLSFDLSPLIN